MESGAPPKAIPVLLADAFTTPDGRVVPFMPVGLLKKDALTGNILFRYLKRYLALNHSAKPIDPVNLPLEDRWHNLGREGRGAIRDTTPDSWGRKVYAAAGRNFGEFEHILAPNPGRLGNIEFGEPARKRNLRLADLPALQRLSLKIERNEDLNAREKAYLAPRLHAFGIGGARPKCVVEKDDGSLWIVKFASTHDTRHEARIERATLHLAWECGIEVTYAEIGEVDGREALFVERFDRNFRNQRRGFLSAWAALGLGRNQGEDDYLKDYRILAERIRQFGMEDDLAELFRRVAFNMIIRNTDDHPRNHGFLLRGNRLRLSPAYDVAPTGLAPDMSRPAFGCMKAGVRGCRFEKANLLSGADAYNLTREEGDTIFERMAEVVGKRWRQLFSDYQVTESDLDKALPVFEFWEKRQEKR